MGRRILIFGTFDHLHPGHRFVLEQALDRAQGGEVCVIVARDSNVRRIKGYEALQDEVQRTHALQESFPSARVLLGDPNDFLAPVRSIEPDLILLGYDQSLPPGVQEEDLEWPTERLPAFKPDQYKSSLLRENHS